MDKLKNKINIILFSIIFIVVAVFGTVISINDDLSNLIINSQHSELNVSLRNDENNNNQNFDENLNENTNTSSDEFGNVVAGNGNENDEQTSFSENISNTLNADHSDDLSFSSNSVRAKSGVDYSKYTKNNPLIIPSSYDGKTITTIGSSGFKDKSLGGVVLPSTITRISYSAFEKNNLEEIVLPYGLKTIDDNAFSDNNIKSIDIPSAVTVINYGWISKNPNLTTITISSLNTSYEVLDNVLYTENMKTLITYPAGKISINFTVPSGVTTIETSAFNSAQIENIDFNSVTNIRPSAFTDSTTLRTVKMSGITELSYSLFRGSTNLRRVNSEVDGEFRFDSIKTIKSYTFEGNSQLRRFFAPGLEKIESDAFKNVNSLISFNSSTDHEFRFNSIKTIASSFTTNNVRYLYVGNSITGISSDAFGSSNIQRVNSEIQGEFNLPNSMQQIGNLISKSSYVKRVNSSTDGHFILPNSLKSIASSLFLNNKRITKVQIPSTVTSMGSGVFEGATNLTQVNSNENNTVDLTNVNKLGSGMFKGATKLWYLKGISSSITEIPYEFFENGNLKTAVLHASIKEIGSHAFYGNTNLSKVARTNVELDQINDGDFVLPTKIEYIRYGAFYDNDGLKILDMSHVTSTLTFFKSGLSGGKGAFEHCSNLTKVILPNSVDTFELGTFQNNPKLTEFYIKGSSVINKVWNYFQKWAPFAGSNNVKIYVPVSAYNAYRTDSNQGSGQGGSWKDYASKIEADPATQTTISLVAGSTTPITKSYDGSTSLSFTLTKNTHYRLIGENSSYVITISYTGATYSNALPGNRNITVSGVKLNGSNAYRYKLSSTTFTLAGRIDKQEIYLLWSGSRITKTYDGTNALPAGFQLKDHTTITNAIGATEKQEILNGISFTSGNYHFKNAGEGEVTLSGLVLNRHSDKYRISSVFYGFAGQINAKEVPITWLPTNYTYNGNLQLPSAVAVTGISGETLNVSVNIQSVNSRSGIDAGNHEARATVTAGPNTLISNYSFVYENMFLTYTIKPKILEFIGHESGNYDVISKTYDGTRSIAEPILQGRHFYVKGEALNDTGIVAQDVISPIYIAKYDQSDVGARIVNVQIVETGNSNYIVSDDVNEFVLSGRIYKATITVSPTGRGIIQKVYDGTISATDYITINNLNISGYVGSETPKLTDFTFVANYTHKNVSAQNNAVTISNITYNNENYNWEIPQNFTIVVEGKITPKPLQVQWSNLELRYNGLSLKPTATVSTEIAGETVNLLVKTFLNGLVVDAVNVGTYVARAEMDPNNNSQEILGNYTITHATTDNFKILSAQLRIVATQTAVEKTYDSLITAIIIRGQHYTIEGINPGDTVYVQDFEAYYNSKNVLQASYVEILQMNIYQLIGDQHVFGNYTVVNIGQGNDKVQLPGKINAKHLTPSWGENRFVYDGQMHAPSVTVATGISNEQLVVSEITKQKNVGIYAIEISIHDSANGHTLASNYLLQNSSFVFEILVKDIVVTWSETTFTYNKNPHLPQVSFETGVVGEQLNYQVLEPEINVGTYMATIYIANGNEGELASNYNIVNKTISFTINPALINLTQNTNIVLSKQYDGGIEIDLTGINFYNITGILEGDVVNLTSYSSNFENKEVQNGKVLYISLLQIDNSNYTFEFNSYIFTGNITKRTITITQLQNVVKEYDGTDKANLTSANYLIDNLIAGDNLGLTYDAKYNSANVIDANSVLVTNIKTTNQNYILETEELTMQGSITPKQLNVIWVQNTLVLEYDGTLKTPTARIDEYYLVTVNGVRDTVQIEVLGGAIAVGNYTATARISNNNLNYTLQNSSTPYRIVATAISVVWETEKLVYNKTEQAPKAYIVIAEEKIYLNVTGAQINAGNAYTAQAVLPSDYENNLSLINPTHLFAIEKREVTISYTGIIEKVYDGSVQASGHYNLNNFVVADAILGDNVKVQGIGQAMYNTKNVSTAFEVTVSGILLDNGNYKPQSSTQTVVGKITPKHVNVTFTQLEFLYDGTSKVPTAEVLSGGDFGLVIGEELPLNVLVSNGPAIQVGLYIATAQMQQENENYVLQNNSANFEIKYLQLTFEGVGIISKEYDGTKIAIITQDNYKHTGNLEGDEVLITSYTAEFATKNAGQDIVVTIKILEISNQNYGLTNDTFTILGNITRKNISVQWQNHDQFVYNGQEQKPQAQIATGIENEEVEFEVVVYQNSQLIVPINVGSYTAEFEPKSVTNLGLVTNFNFELTQINYTITEKEISVSGVGNVTKEYDGTILATHLINRANYEFTGVVGTDMVDIEFNANFNNKDVLNAEVVIVEIVRLINSNYVLKNNVFEIAGSITPKTITVSQKENAIVTKTYDGTTTAQINTTHYEFAGVVLNESVELVNGYISDFNSKNVLQATTVTVSNLNLTTQNYVLQNQSFTVNGNITAKMLEVVWTGLSVQYSGLIQRPTAQAITGIENETVQIIVQIIQNGIDTDAIDIGEYVAIAHINPANANFTLTNETKDFVITEITFEVTWENLQFTYNKTQQQPNAYVSNNPNIELEVIGGQINAGKYSATAQVVGDSNYGLTNNTVEFVIYPSAIALTGSGKIEKVYDGSTRVFNITSDNYSFTGKFEGDEVNIVNFTANYSNSNVARNNPITITGIEIDNGNYALSTLTLELDGAINPRPITATGFGVVRKTYDGTDVANLTDLIYSFANIIEGDVVKLNGNYIANFNSKNVLEANKVLISNLSLTNSNYTLTQTVIEITGFITPKPLSIKVSENVTLEKVYDTTRYTTEILNTHYEFVGIVAGDSVSLVNNYIARFNSQNVIEANSVVVTNLNLDNSNYTVKENSFSINGKITPKQVEIIELLGIVIEREYNGNTRAEIKQEYYTVDGLIGSDNVSLKGGYVANYNSSQVVLANQIVVTNLISNNTNYEITNTSLTFVGRIVPKIITIVGTSPIQKVYDGTITVSEITESNYSFVVPVAGDIIQILSYEARYEDKNVGANNKIFVEQIVIDNENYSLYTNWFTINANITPKVLEVEWDNLVLTYNRLPQSPTAQTTTGIENEEVELRVVGEEINVGTYQAYAVLSVNNNNFALLNNITSYDIVAKGIEVVGKGQYTKVYDGNIRALINHDNYEFVGINDGDIVLITQFNASFNSRNVNEANLITVIDIAINSLNYTLTNTNFTFEGTITKRDITVRPSGTTITKTYDTTTRAFLIPDNYIFDESQLIAGDRIEIRTYQATYNSKNVYEENNMVSANNFTIDNDNYNLTTLALLDMPGEITPKELLLTASGVIEKVYDGTTFANANFASIGGLVDTVYVSFTAEFNSKDVEHARVVYLRNIRLVPVYDRETNEELQDYKNYFIGTDEIEMTGVILPKEISVSWDSVRVFDYDKLTHAPTATVETEIVGETLDLLILGEEVNAGTYTATATIDNLNYMLLNASVPFTINKVNLTIEAGSEIVTKTYDGTTSATLKPNLHYKFIGAMEGDFIAVSYNAEFNSKNVAEATQVNVTGLSITNPNYTLRTQSLTLVASITKKDLTITIPKTIEKSKGAEDPPINFTVDGLIEGDVLNGSLVREKGEEVGKYKITLGEIENLNPNYNIIYNAKDFQILGASNWVIYLVVSLVALLGGGIVFDQLVLKKKRKKKKESAQKAKLDKIFEDINKKRKNRKY